MSRSLVVLALLLTFIGFVAPLPVGAANTLDDNCVENPLVVDDGPNGDKAKRVANGYNCPGVDVTFTSPIAPTENVVINAKSVLFEDGSLVSDFKNSEVRIVTRYNIAVQKSRLAAHKLLWLQCMQVGCTITADDQSSIVAADDFNAPASGDGELHMRAKGPITTKGTFVYGGSKLEVLGYAVSLDCSVVCPPDPVCGAGENEARFTAEGAGGNVTLRGKWEFESHATAKAKNGNVDVANAKIDTTSSLVLEASGYVRANNATLTAAGHITVEAGKSCPDTPGICVDLKNAVVTAQVIRVTTPANSRMINACGAVLTEGTPIDGNLPYLNGDNAPPYPASVFVGPGLGCAAAIFQ